MAGKPADSVLEQAPKAKNKTPKGSKVDLVVCRDPKDLSMPDVMGSSLNDAKKALTELGIMDITVRYIESGSSEGSIVGMEPPAGSKFAADGKVVLQVSSGSHPQSVNKYAEFVVPQGSGPQDVQIILIDANGQRTVYQGAQKAGVRIRQKVEVTGSGKVQFFCNNKMVEEIKTYNGYYYVDSGTDELVTCKVKGKLKQIRFSLCTGDIVEFETNHNGESMITRILPRRNFMLRPTIANVDLIIVAFACINPDFSYLLADKLLVLAEQAGIPAVICLNKIDLAPAGLVAEIEAVYKRAGYEVYAISAQQGINVGKLKDRLYGKITVFAGPSGVGKSSTLNAIEPGMQLVTGSVSEKIGRGKHTTRFAHLLPFAGGYLADTPGFGNLNLEELDDKKLAACFREFAGFEDGCKFTPCTHTHEPICGVKDALAAGEIAQSRYESYLTILEEIKSKKEKDGRK